MSCWLQNTVQAQVTDVYEYASRNSIRLILVFSCLGSFAGMLEVHQYLKRNGKIFRDRALGIVVTLEPLSVVVPVLPLDPISEPFSVLVSPLTLGNRQMTNGAWLPVAAGRAVSERMTYFSTEPAESRRAGWAQPRA
ncbi:hypothetical protein LY76DRAFT_637789 [Colletotrichum caudatum]|nr:hypothetical protein LY76DRAFT_637789 [Colletotrichum caudatum]